MLIYKIYIFNFFLVKFETFICLLCLVYKQKRNQKFAKQPDNIINIAYYKAKKQSKNKAKTKQNTKQKTNKKKN